MKKIMKALARVIEFVFVGIAILGFVVGPTVILYQTIFRSTYIFNDTVYTTIEELHGEYKLSEQINKADDYYPGEIVFTLTVEQDVFVFCESYSTWEGDMNSDWLYVYRVSKMDDGYVLHYPVTKQHYTCLPLHDDYQDFDYKSVMPKNVLFCRTGKLERYAAFAYKEKGSTDILYYNGTKMQEVEQINPFTEETFVLCYAYPPETQKPFEQLFSGMERLFCGFFGRPSTQFVLTVEEGS